MLTFHISYKLISYRINIIFIHNRYLRFSSITNMQFVCQACDKEFSRLIDLTRHKEKKIPCDKILQCRRCDKVFNTQQSHDRHLARKIPCVKADRDIRKLELQLEIEKQKTITEQEKQKTEQEKQKTKSIVSASTITVNNNITFNTNVNKINFNTFKEYHKKADVESLISEPEDPVDTMISLLTHIYNNEKYPERQCIKSDGTQLFIPKNLGGGVGVPCEYKTLHAHVNSAMAELCRV